MLTQSRLFSRLGLSAALAAGAFLTLGCGEKSARDDVITVYSARVEHLISPLFDRYTEETGIQIRYITDNAGALIQRLKAEGSNTPADVLLTVDAGNLWQASREGLFQPLNSEAIEAHIPDHIRAENGDWTGLSVRARTLIYSTERVDPTELSTYEALMEPQWEGRVCLRTSRSVYNQSLVATMIHTLGEDKAESIVRGWVANLATDPFANDTATMEAVVAGQCDVAIVNTYYFGRLQRANPDIPLALFWPNQDGRGVHINVSGGGITRHAKNPEGARALLEWLASEGAQYQFAEVNQEYPANPSVGVSEEVAAWGDFRADEINVEVAGRLQGDAIRLMDRARYR
jgi:iron(III) transport system substrate-binding protein